MRNKLNGLALTAAAFVTSAPAVFAQIQVEEPDSFFFSDIGTLINKALNFVMVLGALLVFMYLIWGGIEWITSGGDKGKTESARNKITAAVLGLIVLAASWAILGLVLNFLGAGSLNDVLDNI
ncbi:MAG: hypothetical protein BroJett025_10980 [Patescibacteria group bacterium]|nr:MAG: hypothetical protein BroJett025_10980 [Patescibacteria group bacterium]